jgi:hypothetical protein
MSSDPVDIRLFGASIYLSDNTDAIQKAIDSGHPVYIPYGGSKNSAFKFERRLKLRPGTVITGGGRTVSILEFTGSGVAIDDTDYGPATYSSLCGFKLQAANKMATVGIQMTNAKIVTLEDLWIEGGQLDPSDPAGERISQKVNWSVTGLSILGVVPFNTYNFRIVGCNISGCKGDGVFVKDDSGTGGLHLLHSRIQGCGGIGFNQVFGTKGPDYKCQVHVEGNDIEGNAGGQINCDSLCGSTFKDNHLENQAIPKGSTVIPSACTVPTMSFGSRPDRGWFGQFFGLSITGNYINSVSANWGIEFLSTAGSIAIIISGNLINGCNDDLSRASRKQPFAAIICRPQNNISIQGNTCTGAFDVDAGGEVYANYEEPYSFSGPYSLYGQDTEGHQLLGDLRFGITKVANTVIIDEHSPKAIKDYNHYYGRSYSFHFQAVNPVDFQLPAHKAGKRLLFKNENVGVAKLIPKSGLIDGSPKPYELAKYAFVELEDDGKDYWIIGSGNGGS